MTVSSIRTQARDSLIFVGIQTSNLGMLQACVDKNYFEDGWRVHNLRTMNEQMAATVFPITPGLRVRL